MADTAGRGRERSRNGKTCQTPQAEDNYEREVCRAHGTEGGVDLSDEEKICSECGTPLERIGEEFLKREFHYIPARGRIIEYYSVNYKCPECSGHKELPEIVKGKDGHPHMIHGMASASTVAWVMYQKYVNCIPLYRQEADFRTQLGVEIGRNTMANWIISNATDFFTPMFEYFHRTLLKRRFPKESSSITRSLLYRGSSMSRSCSRWKMRSTRSIPGLKTLKRHVLRRNFRFWKAFCRGLINRRLYATPDWTRR